jgi:hypothetical protein
LRAKTSEGAEQIGSWVRPRWCLLALDMGNTHIKIGVFDGGRLRLESRIATQQDKTEDQYAAGLLEILRLYGLSAGEVTGAIMSSVVPPLTHTLCRAVQKIVGVEPFVVGPGMKTGVNIRIDNLARGTSLRPEVLATILSGGLQAENTLDEPYAIVPRSQKLAITGNALSVEVQGQSFNVYRIQID